MTNPNDPAFSSEWEVMQQSALQAGCVPIKIHYIGLTKREYFAGKALRGAIEWRDAHSRPEQFDVKALAQDCCVIADALIAELNKEPKP